MPSAWIEHIKAFAKANDMSYKDALKCPKCKEEYHKGKGKGVEAPAEKENISMEISEKKPRGRPKKYATEEERKKAKSAKTIESNKRKKAEGKGVGGSKVAPAPAPATTPTPPPTPRPEPKTYPTADPKNPYAVLKSAVSDAKKRSKMRKEMRREEEEARRKEAEAEYTALKESREKPTGKGIRQELSKARKASEALAQSAQSMKGGMFPKDFMDGIGKSAGGARSRTPSPTIALTQAQGDAILKAIRKRKGRGAELGRVLSRIDGGDSEVVMRRRFEAFVSGFNHPPMVQRLMELFSVVYDESIHGGTDSEGAGLVPSSEETKKQILDSVAYYTEPRMKIFNEAVKKQSKALGGGGLIAGYKAEDAGGLTHIYPLSHAHILEMCKHLI